jgi:UDP-glucose 4-epimerase
VSPIAGVASELQEKRALYSVAVIRLVQHFGAYAEAFNMGHTRDISIREPAVVIKRKTGSPSEIAPVPYEEGYEVGFEDMARRLPDGPKIHRLIGYEPTLDLGEMLDRIIAQERTLARHAKHRA